VPGASVHWYGKREVVAQRKLGHVTIVAPDAATAHRRLAAIDARAEALLSATPAPAPGARALRRGARLPWKLPPHCKKRCCGGCRDSFFMLLSGRGMAGTLANVPAIACVRTIYAREH